MSEAQHKIGVVPATLMVAGNIMGSGVFMLPANLAATGGVAIYGWIVTIIGAVCLSLVYARMAAIDPSPGGSYAYARRTLGPFMGYQTNLFYWTANWVGNVAIAVIGVGYLSYFFPILSEPMVSAVASIGMIWLFTYLNILGPNLTARVQSVTTLVALFVIVGVGVFAAFHFDSSIYMASWNVKHQTDFSAVQSVLNITLWAFVGVETAAVSAGVVNNPQKNVPIATVGGVLIAAVCYLLSCTAIMGMIPGGQLALSSAPFADAAKLALGEVGGGVVSFCAAVGCLGSLGGWIMATGLTAKAAADDGLFPRFFKDSNEKGTPVKGILVVAVLMSFVILLTISPNANKEFAKVSSVAVLLVIVAYMYVTAALLSFKRHFIISGITLAYCSWAVWGTKHQEAAWLAIFLLLSAALYALNGKGTKEGT